MIVATAVTGKTLVTVTARYDGRNHVRVHARELPGKAR